MLTPLLKQALLPPASLLLLLAIGLIFARRRFGVGWWTAVVTTVLIYGLSTPLGADFLGSRLETFPVLSSARLNASQAQAIVIFGADSDYQIEIGGETVGSLTLARLRYGAWLHKRTGLPILVSGGTLERDERSLAGLMGNTLENDYGITDVWLEPRSRDTWENAMNSAVMLREKNIERFYLVTHARDMGRAVWSFQRVGLQPIPAPMALDEQRAEGLRCFVPSARSMLSSYYALYELIGGAAYRLRH